ncbi:MAG: tRNA pseudouridine(55) synthase TruB [Firmicutes bacterium]|nr:tRNA pseudouridine(55) synthase TruB [Bacillota bacterium]
MDGIVYINKEKDMTSRDVVNIVSKKLHTKKVGHTGTLDPMATGVLVICVGKATKLVEVLTNHDKEYIAQITLGIQTDTGDITGTILKEEESIYSKEEIESVLKSMVGTYEQTVPIYSAVKIHGKKLYEYARNGESVELPKRMVTISSLELVGEVRYQDSKTIFQVKTNVSKGTYIRSLVNDIADKLNTIGTMSALERTRVGDVSIEVTEPVSNDTYQIHSIYDVLSQIYETRVLLDEISKKVLNGAKIENTEGLEHVFFVNQKKEPIALYQKRESELIPWKMF